MDPAGVLVTVRLTRTRGGRPGQQLRLVPLMTRFSSDLSRETQTSIQLGYVNRQTKEHKDRDTGGEDKDVGGTLEENFLKDKSTWTTSRFVSVEEPDALKVLQLDCGPWLLTLGCFVL